MNVLETVLLINLVRWVWRWLSSNEKNRKKDMDKIIDETVDILHDEFGNKDGD